jgi:hypothetical protein
MKKRLAILVLLLLVGYELQAQDAAKPKLRTWKDSTGKFSFEAVFVRVSGDQVVLQGADKKELSVPLAKLSEADRQYVKQLTTPKPIDKSEQEAISVLEKLGASVKKDSNGHVIDVSFFKNEKFTDADLKHLINLKHLTSLTFRSSSLTGVGLEHLKGINSLKNLDLGATKVKDADLSHLKGLKRLEKLNLMNNRDNITDAGMIHLQGLASLKKLSLSDTVVGDAGLLKLQALPVLEDLDLRGTNITNTGLKHLQGIKNLKYILLWSTKISDAGLVHLKGIKKLRVASLKFTPVSDAAVAELRQALPNSRIEQ